MTDLQPTGAPLAGAQIVSPQASAAARARAIAFLRWAGWIVLGALVLMAPVFINGRVFPFTDSATYFQSGYHTLRILFEGAGLPISEFSRAYLAARSPYYGVFITGVEYIGTLWLIVVMNALASAIFLRALARIISAERANAIYATLFLGLTVFSALPLFVGFIMPDVTAAFAIGAIGLLVFYPERLTLGEKVLLWTMLASALAFHPTHGMISIFLAPVALAFRWFMRKKDVVRRAAVLSSAMAVGMGAWALFSIVNNASDRPQYSPPFITARLLADGTGKKYLRKACAENQNAYALCAYKDLPFAKSDDVLWGWQKDRGVFAVATPETRLALLHEQRRFAINTVLNDPLGQALASLRNFGLQLISVGVDEGFKLDAQYWMTYPKDFYLREMAIRARLCDEKAKTCPARLPLDAIQIWLYITTGLAALYMAAWYYRSAPAAARGDQELRLFMAFGAVVLAGIVINAAVCGVISGPFARYQARVAWLLPTLAIIAEMRFPILTTLLTRTRRADPASG